jgi:hypothetical protein
MVEDTIQNLEASHETMKYASKEGEEQIKEKINDVKKQLKKCAWKLKMKHSMMK